MWEGRRERNKDSQILRNRNPARNRTRPDRESRTGEFFAERASAELCWVAVVVVVVEDGALESEEVGAWRRADGDGEREGAGVGSGG